MAIGSDVVETGPVLLRYAEPVLLNQLGKPALATFDPGQLRFLQAAGTDNEQAVAAAVFHRPTVQRYLSLLHGSFSV